MVISAGFFHTGRGLQPIGEITMTANLARLIAVALTLLLVAIPKTWAGDQTITLRLGIGSTLALERSFKAVLIGDPDVVDVHTRNDRSVMLEPLNPGTTNLIFVDAKSIAITNVRILVCGAGAIPIKYRDEPDCE
jgi:Flp pilus assembly secretin CpaC